MPNGGNFNKWEDEDIKFLVDAIHNKRMSAAVIAAEFAKMGRPFTRNAVISKANRMGMIFNSNDTIHTRNGGTKYNPKTEPLVPPLESLTDGEKPKKENKPKKAKSVAVGKIDRRGHGGPRRINPERLRPPPGEPWPTAPKWDGWQSTAMRLGDTTDIPERPRHCRYIYDDANGADTIICGASVSVGTYCSHHALYCMTPAGRSHYGRRS